MAKIWSTIQVGLHIQDNQGHFSHKEHVAVKYLLHTHDMIEFTVDVLQLQMAHITC